MPKRTIHNFKKVQRSKKSTSKIFLKSALKNTRINVEKSDGPSTSDVLARVTFDVEDKGFSASFNLCPKVDRILRALGDGRPKVGPVDSVLVKNHGPWI